jgi:hypothetical protein
MLYVITVSRVGFSSTALELAHPAQIIDTIIAATARKHPVTIP